MSRKKGQRGSTTKDLFLSPIMCYRGSLLDLWRDQKDPGLFLSPLKGSKAGQAALVWKPICRGGPKPDGFAGSFPQILGPFGGDLCCWSWFPGPRPSKTQSLLGVGTKEKAASPLPPLRQLGLHVWLPYFLLVVHQRNHPRRVPRWRHPILKLLTQLLSHPQQRPRK